MEQPQPKEPQPETLDAIDPSKIKPAPLPELPAGKRGPWRGVLTKSGSRAVIIGGIIFLLLLIAGIGGLYYALKEGSKSKLVNTTSPGLNEEELRRGASSQSTIGTANQTLSIGAKSYFGQDIQVEGSAGIRRDLTVAGKTTLNELEAAKFAIADLEVKGRLTVTGPATYSNTLSVASQLTAGTLAVSGNSSFGGTLTGGNLSVRATTVAGTLTVVGHVVSGGPAPGIVGGGGLGGGTVSISGNDTAGRVNCNATVSAPAGGGVLCSITFRSAYGGPPIVILTPTTPGSGKLNFYVTSNSTSFSISTTNQADPANLSYGFNYWIVQ